MRSSLPLVTMPYASTLDLVGEEVEAPSPNSQDLVTETLQNDASATGPSLEPSRDETDVQLIGPTLSRNGIRSEMRHGAAAAAGASQSTPSLPSVADSLVPSETTPASISPSMLVSLPSSSSLSSSSSSSSSSSGSATTCRTGATLAKHDSGHASEGCLLLSVNGVSTSGASNHNNSNSRGLGERCPTSITISDRVATPRKTSGRKIRQVLSRLFAI
ncbi:MAG: hypothetical protein J3Q66DRAFT_424590 [Benniella sp.]|nr:MAG: hypothetical protein J3Q66DRAFT_424590 [Benniella sp.]